MCTTRASLPAIAHDFVIPFSLARRGQAALAKYAIWRRAIARNIAHKSSSGGRPECHDNKPVDFMPLAFVITRRHIITLMLRGSRGSSDEKRIVAFSRATMRQRRQAKRWRNSFMPIIAVAMIRCTPNQYRHHDAATVGFHGPRKRSQFHHGQPRASPMIRQYHQHAPRHSTALRRSHIWRDNVLSYFPPRACITPHERRPLPPCNRSIRHRREMQIFLMILAR